MNAEIANFLLGDRLSELLRLENDEVVSAGVDFIAFDLGVLLNRRACRPVNEFATHTVAGYPIHRVERGALSCGRCGIKCDRDG